MTFQGTNFWEGGAVIKSTNANTGSARLIFPTGPIECRTSAFDPIVFTGKDDDSIGAAISGSTGNPATNYYGKYIDLAGNPNAMDLHDVRIRHAYYGINMNNGVVLNLSHAQLGSNWAAIVNFAGGQTWLRNVLMHDGTYAFGSGGTNRGEHVTLHRFVNFRNFGYTNAWLTNTLIISVTNNVVYNGSNDVKTYTDDSGIFQTVGSATHYLSGSVAKFVGGFGTATVKSGNRCQA